MSFLNPVNEPVLRFSSTDADAPQINYNSRTAGDVKAVLKACLVDGYGTTASAGWSVVNEAGSVAEFVSPSAAMSDYRLGIDDTSTSNTTWYYQYQNVRTDPTGNKPAKNLSYIDKSNPANGWELLVTARGLYFVEFGYLSSINNLACRLTWIGSIKSALAPTGINIGFFSAGYYNGANSSYPHYLLGDSYGYKHYSVGPYTECAFAGANLGWLSAGEAQSNASLVNIAAAVYLRYATTLVGQQPGLVFNAVNNITDNYGVSIDTIDNRQVLRIGLSPSTSSASEHSFRTRVAMIYLDYWEY